MKCKYCDLDGLEWRETNHKWHLYDLNAERPHQCKIEKPTGKYNPNLWYCSIHKIEVRDWKCLKCEKFISVCRGSELN